MDELSKNNIKIGQFILNPINGFLKSENNAIEGGKLEPQTLNFFLLLIKHQGNIVSREFIENSLWNGRYVSDDAIRAVVKKLRQSLSDDAKNPQYIKTHPLKGYSLIVEPKQDTAGRENKATSNRIFVLSTSAFLIACVLIFFIFNQKVGIESDVRIEPLTHMRGAEVRADYSEVNNALLFVNRENNDSPLQLYLKNLDNGQVQRLTWDNGNYSNAYWAPQGDRFIYTRSEHGQTTHFTAQYINGSISESLALNSSNLSDKIVLSWSKISNQIYLRNTDWNGSSNSIFSFNLETQQLTQITTANVNGFGDFFAKESLDGRLLAILSEQDNNNFELRILNIESGELIARRNLPFDTTRLAWRADNQAVVFSGFLGQLGLFEVQEDKITQLNLNTPNINDVFFQCGSLCFYMRQHNGNYTDIREIPNPFLNASFLAGRHFYLKGAEDLPVYSDSGDTLFYVSIFENKLNVIQQNTVAKENIITTLSRESEISTLAVNKQATLLSAIINNRVTLIDSKSGKIQYITNALVHAQNPTWNAKGDVVFYTVSQGQEHHLYQYSIESKKHSYLASDILALKEIDKDKFVFIDAKNNAWFAESKDRIHNNRKLIGTVTSSFINTWHVKDNNLFYTQRIGLNTILNKINIHTKERAKSILAKNRFRLNFDVHPTQNKVIEVQSLLAQSDIVKVYMNDAK